MNAKTTSSAITLYNELISAIEERSSMQKVMRKYACYVLACCAGNKSKAAERLDLDRRTLHRWEVERMALAVP